ncbi:phage head closure protein [Alkalihalobacterium alkalinitrilicum]|uniref:phage head closure protein n=1 Tax=Alkalihalobacterium alkalinitrilicum TaxID=427920 RepID=UPI0009952CA2|nr:phage head closure protein [Alkalihalobacterium alkalinitrilicum]
MNTKKAKQRIKFQRPAGSLDDDGFPIKQPTEYVTVWAELKTLKGRTFYAAAQNNMQHNREFKIRYNRKLDDRERPKGLIVIWKEVEHDIVSIENDDGLNKTMTVVVKAVS